MPASERPATWQHITLYLLTLAVLLLAGLILYPFFGAIVGAIVLAVMTERPYNRLASKIRNPTACATIALIIVILAVIIPLFFLTQELAEQAINAVSALRNDANQQKIADFILSHPTLADRIQAVTASIDIAASTRATAAYIGRNIGSILGDSVRLITQLVVMLVILFFLFRDRALAISFLRSLLPLSDDETSELLERVRNTIDATALGRLTIALVQGVLAGLALWALGVPGVILWSFTLTAFAMIPAFGAALVWGPIALYLGFTGHWGKAALLAIWGGLIVSTIDNILYPILIGSRLRAHTATILLSILGGIALFGITGIILGPVIFNVAVTLLEFWRIRTAPQASS